MNRHRICLSLALALAGLSGCQGETESDFARGEALLAKRDYQGALAAYQAAERSEKGSPRTARQIGMAYAGLGDRPSAIKYLEDWSRRSPADTAGRLALGQLYVADGRPDDGLRIANDFLAKSPSNVGALTLAAAAYNAKGESAKATDTYRKIAQFSPKDANSLYLAGTGLVAQGKLAEASAQFEAALAQKPALFPALEQIVSIDVAGHRSAAAVQRVKQQIGIVGDSVALKEILAVAHAANGERNLAEAELLEVIKRSPGYLAPYARLSDLYKQWGKYDEATAILARAAKVDPKSKDLRLVEGTTYEAKGDRQGAIRAYEAALAIDPNFAPAGNNLAMVLAESGTDLDKALLVIANASAADPNNPAITDTFGWVLFKRGEYAKALTKLKDVASKLPNEPTVAYHLGLTESKTGDLVAARRDLQRAVSSTTKFPEREAAQKALAALR